MTTHFYLKPSISVRNRMVASGKNNHLRSYATIGQAELEVSHNASGTYFYSGEFSFDKNPCQGNPSLELAEATEHLTYSNSLPDGCLREVGIYSLGNVSAQLIERGEQQGKRRNEVFVTAPNFKSLQQLWQALLDGSIRPERPLFSKGQQGPSYNELATAVAEMTPQLRRATSLLSEAESWNIHLKTVVQSCNSALQGQTRTIATLQGALAVAENQRQQAARQIDELRSWVR